jgi:hypothetical protein
VIKYRQFTKGQKIFVIMAIFVCGLLFYANAVAFNLISAPNYVGDIVAFSALTVAVTLTIITLTIVIRDKLKGLFLKSQKSNVDSVVKLDQASDTVFSPTLAQTSADKVESDEPSTQTIESFDETPDTISSPVIGQITDDVEPNPAAVQTANQTDKAPVTPQPKSSIKKSLIAILIAITAGLLLYVNVVSFKLIALPEYTIYVALAGVAALTITTMATGLVDKRKGALTKAPIVEVDGAIKESNEESETPDTFPSPTIAEESIENVDSNDRVIQNIEVLDEVATAVLPATEISKRRSLFASIIVTVVGLLVYVNIVAFGLFGLPLFSMYVAAVGAAGLIGVIFIVALADKRRGALAKMQKANVVSAVKELNETVPSSVDFQESTSEVETEEKGIQTLTVSDEAQVSVLPKAKSSKKKNALIFIIAIAVSLLFLANCVAFGLISLPDYFAYAFVAGASALTIITIAAAFVDKRKRALPKAPIVDVDGAIEKSNATTETPDIVSSPTLAQTSADKVESDLVAFETVKVPDETPVPIAPPAKVFGKRNLFVIVVAFTGVLLFFANAVAFGLISLPEYATYVALAGAVALAAIALTMILGEKIKVLGSRVKRFVSEPDIQEIINEVKEPDQAPDTASAPVIAQTSSIKVDPYAEMLRQFRVQRTARRLEVDTEELEKELPKKPVIPPTTVMCPACRKEFNLPNYERDYIVDFGRPKQSNLIKQCPYCQTSVPLKRRGVVEEDDIWKD